MVICKLFTILTLLVTLVQSNRLDSWLDAYYRNGLLRPGRHPRHQKKDLSVMHVKLGRKLGSNAHMLSYDDEDYPDRSLAYDYRELPVNGILRKEGYFDVEEAPPHLGSGDKSDASSSPNKTKTHKGNNKKTKKPKKTKATKTPKTTKRTVPTTWKGAFTKTTTQNMAKDLLAKKGEVFYRSKFGSMTTLYCITVTQKRTTPPTPEVICFTPTTTATKKTTTVNNCILPSTVKTARTTTTTKKPTTTTKTTTTTTTRPTTTSTKRTTTTRSTTTTTTKPTTTTKKTTSTKSSTTHSTSTTTKRSTTHTTTSKLITKNICENETTKRKSTRAMTTTTSTHRTDTENNIGVDQFQAAWAFFRHQNSLNPANNPPEFHGSAAKAARKPNRAIPDYYQIWPQFLEPLGANGPLVKMDLVKGKPMYRLVQKRNSHFPGDVVVLLPPHVDEHEGPAQMRQPKFIVSDNGELYPAPGVGFLVPPGKKRRFDRADDSVMRYIVKPLRVPGSVDDSHRRVVRDDQKKSYPYKVWWFNDWPPPRKELQKLPVEEQEKFAKLASWWKDVVSSYSRYKRESIRR